ncbi:hypothetical protein QQS21_006542 [Conoideocrella luteorostrata]|uniref:Uncharacterized protein n=1 Tax=Conoideocrella luteorostrata TaxID=1105319 RepID=A0AAJ0CMH2_9HYPO|nr:hypothetical protein QQS21_006542 [Conoideocrella luteorostrata]
MRGSTLLLAALPAAFAAPAERTKPAPLSMGSGTTGKYIVKLRDGTEVSALNSAIGLLSVKPEHVYNTAFRGFASSMDESTLEAVRMHPDVEYVEEDGIATIAGFVDQQNPVWGLARISSRTKGKRVYTYDERAGEGTCSYVIDTGVDENHREFEGRAKQVKSWIPNSNRDDHGHGTHVSGTIGSKTYGVAKKTKIYGLKVLGSNASGPDSGIIDALNFVAEDAPKRDCPKGVFVNLSLTADRRLQSMNDAAAALVRKGYFVAAAAGNFNRDAAQESPASEPTICTVGGTQENDGRYSGSNYGKFIDINAPAVQVTSTMPGGGTGGMTGTSMASPHVVGLAAYLSSVEGITASSACDRIVQLATKGAITGRMPPNTVNLLAFNGNTKGF